MKFIFERFYAFFKAEGFAAEAQSVHLELCEAFGLVDRLGDLDKL